MVAMSMSKQQLVEAVLAQQAELQAKEDEKKAASDGDMQVCVCIVGCRASMAQLNANGGLQRAIRRRAKSRYHYSKTWVH